MREETEELVVAVPVLAEPSHLPSDDLQRSEQSGGTMADVVVTALLVVTRFHHTHLLGTVQRLELGPRPDGTPQEAWAAHAAALRSATNDEETLLTTYDSFFGPTTLADTLLSFYCFDLIVHAWDIHQATGNDLNLTSTELDLLETCIRSWGEVLYQEGICKQPVEVPDDADRQTRILALTGRRR